MVLKRISLTCPRLGAAGWGGASCLLGYLEVYDKDGGQYSSDPLLKVLEERLTVQGASRRPKIFWNRRGWMACLGQSRTETVEGQYQGLQQQMRNLATWRGANTGMCFDLTKIQGILECNISIKFVAWSKCTSVTFFIHAALWKA